MKNGFCLRKEGREARRIKRNQVGGKGEKEGKIMEGRVKRRKGKNGGWKHLNSKVNKQREENEGLEGRWQRGERVKAR